MGFFGNIFNDIGQLGNVVRLGAAQVTGNQVAQQHAQQALNQPARTPAPVQQGYSQQVARTPAPMQNRAQPIQYQQHASPLSNMFHTGLKDFQGVVNQVNPFDNGRTFKNPTPQVAHQGSVLQQATHNAVSNVAGGAVKFVPQFAADYSNTFANLGNRAAGGHNVPIQQNIGTDPLSRGIINLGGATGTNKQLAGAGAQVALSALSGVGKGASLLAKTGVGAGLGAGFNAANTFGAGGNLKQIGQSAAVGAALGGALPGAGVVAKRVAPILENGAKLAGNKAVGIATQKPFRNLSDAELQASARVAQSRAGFGQEVANVQPGDMATYRQVQQKLGVGIDNHQAVEDAINARNMHAQAMAQRLQTVKDANTKLNSIVNPNGVQIGGSLKPVTNTAENTATKTTTKLLPTEPVAPTTALVPKAEGSSLGNDSLQPSNKPSRHANVTLQNSDKITPLTKQLVKAKNVQYSPVEVKAGQTAAKEFAKDPNAAAHIQQTLSATDGHISFQDALNTHAVVDKLQSTGKPEDSALAAGMLSRLSEHHTAAGQQLAAAAAMSKRSPLGIVTSARKLIENGGKGGSKQEITPALQAKLDAHQKAITEAETAANKAEDAHAKAITQANKDLANKTYKVGQLKDTLAAQEAADSKRLQVREDLQKTIGQNIHHSKGSKAFALWRTGLLTGPRTMTKVAVSHTGMGLLEQAKQIPAAGLDATISAGSRLAGRGAMRSTAFAPQRGISDLGKGVKAGVHLLKTGHDTPGTGGFAGTMAGSLTHTNAQFSGKVGKILNPYMEKTGQIHASVPKPFYTYANKNSLYKQAIANTKNLGLQGSDRAAYIDHFVHAAPDVAKQEAMHDGQFAAFQQNSASGNVAKALQHVPGGKLIMPFAHIASTILADAAHYSPASVGIAAHDVIKALKGGEGWTPQVQKHFVEELGRGITGTAVGAVGFELAKQGLISGGYPTTPSERALWKAEGRTPNSILINGKWRSTSTLEPAGTLLAAGQSAYEATQNNGKGKSQLTPSITGALQDMTSQSYLSGLTGLSDAVAHPTQYGTKFLKQEAGSVVPIALSTVATATDPKQRNTAGFVDALKSKIPGARESLTPTQNMYGQDLSRQGGVLTGLLDPTRPSNAVNDKTTNELQRLQDTTGSTSIPTDVKSINGLDANGKKVTVPLNTQQQHDFSATAGPQIKRSDNSIMNNPDYSQLTDANKVAALNSGKDRIQNVTKANTAASVKPGTTVKLTNSEANGSTPDFVQNKINEQSGGTAGTPIAKNLDATSKTFLNKYNGMTAAQRTQASNSNPAFTYNYAQAKYNNDKANGSLSLAEDAKAQAALAKDQVGSTFDKNIRDLYGLSAKELYGVVSNNPDGNNLVSKVLAYGDALASAGVETKNKFRTSKGAVNINSPGQTAAKKASGARSSSISKNLAAAGKAKNFYSGGGKKAPSMGFKLPSLKAPKIASSAGKVKLTNYKVASVPTIKKPSGVLKA